jgi:hypothetical protein
MKQRWRLWLLVGLAACIGIAILVAALHQFASLPSRSSDDLPSSVARDYIAEKEGWPDAAYTVENTWRRDDEGNVIVNVVHKEDLKSHSVGGGKSLEMHIDLQRKEVVKVLHFQ